MDVNLLSRLQKLLALSTSRGEGGAEGEAQAAASLLAKMLEAHNLDIADLEQRGAVKPGIHERAHDLGKAAFKWKLDLAEFIAEHYYCASMVDRRTKRVAFVGRPDNVEALTMLYQWLIDQVRAIASEARRTHLRDTGEHVDPLRWQVGFGEGAAKRIGERLKDRRRQESSDAGSALVVSHASEVSDYLEEVHGYRLDGRKTAAQVRADEGYKQWLEGVKVDNARLAALKLNDPEAYYRERPWDTPEAHAEREAEREAERKREERNAKRRTGRAYRYATDEEVRRDSERRVASSQGRAHADSINLSPFLGAGKEPKGAL